MKFTFAFVVLVCGVLAIAVSEKCFAQPGVDDVIFKGNDAYVYRVYFSCKKEVIWSTRGAQSVSIDDIAPEYPALKKYLGSLDDVMILKVVPDAVWGDTIRTNNVGQQVSVPDLSQHFALHFKTPVNRDAVLNKLRSFPEIDKAVGPSMIISEADCNNDPNDPLWRLLPRAQWHLEKIRTGGALGAWNITKGGKNIVGGSPGSIGTLDAEDGGIAWQHADIQNKKRGGDNLTTTSGSNHHTRVIAMAAAETNNSIGLAGVGWETRFTPLQVLNNGDVGTKINQLAALNYVEVITMPFIFLEALPNNGCRPMPYGNLPTNLEPAIIGAYSLGKILVASGGNPPSSHCQNPTHTVPYVSYPAAFSQVIGVGATNSSDNISLSYNRGPQIGIAAPGLSIVTTFSQTGYTDLSPISGTSYAAPQVAGVVALMRDIRPGITKEQVNVILRSTPQKSGTYPYVNGRNDYYGYGRLDAYRAVREAIPTPWIQASNNPSFPTYWTAFNTYNNTGVFITNYDRTNYPRSYAQLGSSITLDNTSLVVERETWLRTGGFLLRYQNGACSVREPGAEILITLDGVEEYAVGTGAVFQGAGACVGLKGGTLRLLDNAEIRVNNQGVLANFDPSTIELGTIARIIIEADGNLVWNANTNIIFGQGSSIEVYGTVKVGNYTTLTIPNGWNLNIHEGAKFEMGDDASIVVASQLVAVGTWATPIRFQLQQGTSKWLGITGLSGSTVYLDHVEISGVGSGTALLAENRCFLTMLNSTIDVASIGVQIVPPGSQIPQPPPTIQFTNNTFTNIGTGLILNNSSNVNFNDNTLYGTNYSGEGVTCIASSPIMLRNRIKNFAYGLHCLSNSAPMLESYNNPGNNVIVDNTIGVRCETSSDANLGLLGPSLQDVGGMNGVYGNVDYDVQVMGQSTVHAQSDWLGSEKESDFKLDIEQYSELIYKPWLEYDPNPAFRIQSSPLAKNIRDDISGEVGVEGNGPVSNLIKLAMQERRRGNHNSASVLLRNIVAHPTMSQSEKQWALSHLLAVSHRMNNAGLSSYLLPFANAQSTLSRKAKALLPFSYWSEGAATQALAAFNANIQQYPNSDLARAGVYGKFVYALHSVGDTLQALSLLNQLRSSYPSSSETKIAARQYNAFPRRGVTGSNSSSLNASSHRPEITSSKSLAFALEENFPNPFNPSTTIRFAIPQHEHVTLIVYDLLGREVTTLVNEARNAGSYDETFDASKFASGVYVYRLAAGSFSQAKRLVLLK